MFQIPMKVEKSIEVSKPPKEVFDYIADFSTWPTWSPWLCQERQCPVDIKGSAGKPGHGQAWDGKIIGAGEMSIVDLTSPQTIDYDLSFLKPFKSKSTVQFRLAEEGGHTRVTWNMDSSLPVYLFFLKKMMVTMVGADYERGLQMLKSALENGEVPSLVEERGEVERPGFYWIGRRRTCAISDMPRLMKEDLDRLEELSASGEIPEPEFVFSVYHKWNFGEGTCEFASCYAYDEPQQYSELSAGHVSAHRAFRVDHIGSYEFLGNAYSAAMAHQRAKKLKLDKDIGMYEVYESDSGQSDEKDLVTAIYVPLK